MPANISELETGSYPSTNASTNTPPEMTIQNYFRSQTSSTPSSSRDIPFTSSFVESPTPDEPIESTEQTALQRITAGSHCRQFPIDWSSLRCPESKLLVRAQYRIRH